MNAHPDASSFLSSARKKKHKFRLTRPLPGAIFPPMASVSTNPSAAPLRTLLHRGGPLNARVYLVESPGEAPVVEKDFSDCNWFVRHTVGRYLIWRETLVLRHLSRKTGLVPSGVRRVSPFRLQESFQPGFALRDSLCGAFPGNIPRLCQARGVPRDMLLQPVPRSFFEALEAGVRACHAARFVHLDLHNARNIIVGPGWQPVLLDWQSALPTFWLPPPLRRALERIDLAGVYTFWDKFRPGELPPGRRRFLARSRFLRKHFWFPRLHLPS